MKNLIAITHVDFENLGSWEEALSTHYSIKYIHSTELEFSNIRNQNIDLLVILGGPIGVYQENEYPFLSTELKLLEDRLKLNLPTLGICLGSQLIARALGSKVYPNHTKEIGWYPLNITEEGKNNYIHSLDSKHTSMFHWHGDTFDLPKEATLLASTQICKNQIFSYKNTLAFQCHPEISANHLEKWWIGHAAELSQNNLNVNHLRNQSIQLAPKLQKQSLQCLLSWIETLK
ncbi:MAG: glutamine amidotransferase [Parachlamydiaceae bacterium]|nr:glutamine amidotransferase [Parachlamydiaceae bacterium]